MKLTRFALLISLFSLLFTFSPLASVMAQQPTAELKATATHTKIENTADRTFEWEVALEYKGGARTRSFDLSASTPASQFFQVAVQGSLDGTRIRDISLDPDKGFPDRVKVTATPVPWNLPKPGQYQVKLDIASGDLKASIDLSAEVTARFEIDLQAPQGNLFHRATAGKESTYTFSVVNNGTSAVGDVNFTASKPDGWTVTFTPDKLGSLDPGATRDVVAKIQPAGKTIAGDYMVTITGRGKDAEDRLEVRVSIATSTLWGWVGIGIVLAVIAGLALVFARLGRR